MGFFSRKKDAGSTVSVGNVLDASGVIRGDVQASNGYRVDGRIEGTLRVEGPVIVGPKGTVVGNVEAVDITVWGRIEGNVHVDGHLEIGPEGAVHGDVSMASLQVHKGGVFLGTSRTALEKATTRSEAPRALPSGREHRTLPPPQGIAVPPPAPADASKSEGGKDVARPVALPASHGTTGASAAPDSDSSAGQEAVVSGVVRSPSVAPDADVTNDDEEEQTRVGKIAIG